MVAFGRGAFLFLVGKGGSERLWEEVGVVEVRLSGVVFDVDCKLIFFHLFVM